MPWQLKVIEYTMERIAHKLLNHYLEMFMGELIIYVYTDGMYW